MKREAQVFLPLYPISPEHTGSVTFTHLGDPFVIRNILNYRPCIDFFSLLNCTDTPRVLGMQV